MWRMKTYCLALLIALAVLIFAACGQDRKPVLNVYNWGDYIDESVIDEFEKEFNIRVNYDTFSTNEDMYVKVKSGGGNYDLLFPSDYTIERMRKEGMLQKLDFNNIPNYQYLEEQFKNLDYDP